VKGVRYVDHVDAGDPVEVAQLYDAQEADEITFLDITASHEERSILLDVVSRTAETVFMPLTVGGGVRSLADVRDLLNAGADKVSIMTAAVRDPDLVAQAAAKIGSANLVIAIDARRVASEGGGVLVPSERTGSAGSSAGAALAPVEPGVTRWEVCTHGGREPAGIDAVTWAERMAEAGAGEILLTSMDRDGTKAGYDLELLRAVADRVPIPVIASGGGGSAEDLAAALNEGPRGGHAQAALAASIFHFRETTVGEVKRALLARGIPVRPPSGPAAPGH
jgi:cyclase